MANFLGELQLHAEPLPLQMDEGGVLRIGRSRVSLDLIVEQYENGMTPEDLVRAYDSLELADVYAAIAYYLKKRGDVVAYLKQRGAEADTLRQRIEAHRPKVSRRELEARKAASEKADVATGS